MVMLVSFAPGTIRPDADYPLDTDANGKPTGQFFTQTNGRDPGATPLGFSVRDTFDGPALYSEFERLGGVDELGYPIAQQATFKGFAIQITQRAVLQWVPNAEGTDGQAVRLNVMDELASSGYDDYLYTQLQVPKSFNNEGDDGLSFEEVQERHLKFLDNNLLTKRAYLETPNAISEYGLPTAFEEFEDVYVVRTQRAVIQLWKVSRPWAQAGEATIMGAVYAAAFGIGALSSLEEINTLRKENKRFEPNMEIDQRMALMKAWRIAVKKSFQPNLQ